MLYKDFSSFKLLKQLKLLEEAGYKDCQIHHIIMIILHNDKTYIPKCSPLILNHRTQFNNTGNVQT